MFFIIIGAVLFVYFGILLTKQIRAKQWKIARLSAVIVAIGLAGVITGFVMVSGSLGDPDAEKITLQEYEWIEKGMTYDEVVEIVGSRGEKTEVSEADGDREAITNYTFEGIGGPQANATMYFQGDKLIIKAQMSLE